MPTEESSTQERSELLLADGRVHIVPRRKGSLALCGASGPFHVFLDPEQGTRCEPCYAAYAAANGTEAASPDEAIKAFQGRLRKLTGGKPTMPTNDSITIIRDCLEASLAYSMDVNEEVVFEGEYRQALAALEELAEENRDRPWEGAGPSVAEAGGESILVREADGDLHRATREFTDSFGENWEVDGWPVTRAADGSPGVPPTGWRPMPKADDVLTVNMTITSDPGEAWGRLRKITNPEELVRSREDEAQKRPILVCECGKGSTGRAGDTCPHCGSRSTWELLVT